MTSGELGHVPCIRVGAEVAMNEMPGSVGAYRLERLLGEGGMGAVYAGVDTRDGTRVAIKRLKPALAQEPDAVSRFFAEARTVNLLAHPGVVRIVDFLPEAHCYVMELLEGEDLGALLRRRGALPASEVVAMGRDICDALAAVHAAGIVHRDLKPENVFLSHGRVKVLDFGVAKLERELEGTSLLRTAAGVILGTPAYMAPEQMSGAAVDARSDVYALGAILYELVTGRRPFAAKSFGELVIKHLTVAPRPPSELRDDVPQDLEAVILACLAKTPEARPPSMTKLGTQLEACMQGQAPKRPRHYRRPVTAMACAALFVCTSALATPRLFEPHPPAPEPTAAVPAVPAPPIELAFDSSPTGATVIRLSDGASLGTTPFSFSAAPSPDVCAVEFRRRGYVSARASVTPDKSTVVSVVLARLPKRAPRPSHTTARGLIDPFTEE